MDESDSESEAGSPAIDDGPRYPYEGKFKDAVDKAEIMAMPEIQREQILADRADEANRDAQTRALRALLKSREQTDKISERKRKAEGSDSEGEHRKTSRQRTKIGGGRVGESSSGIETLKRARDEKADRQRRREEDNKRNGGRRMQHDSESDHSDRDDRGRGYSEPKRDEYTPEPVKASPAELEHIEGARIGRAHFAKLAFYPGFEETFTGTFVRICIGPDSKGVPEYRMCEILGKFILGSGSRTVANEIIGFNEGKPYAMEKPNGQTFIINLYAKAAHGKAQRDWPLITCSNSPFTQREWLRYKEVCADDKIPMPTVEALEDKKQAIKALENRTWTDTEISERLRKQGLLNGRSNAQALAKYRQQLRVAKEQGNYEKVRELEDEINKLEPPKLAYGTSLVKKLSGEVKESEQDRIARHNAEQRRKNNQEIKAAELRERAERRKQDEAIARGDASVAVDTSRRVRTRAVLTHDVNSPSGTSTPKGVTSSQQKNEITAEKVLPHIAKLQAQRIANKGFGQISKALTDDDVIGAMDLGIDIDMDLS